MANPGTLQNANPALGTAARLPQTTQEPGAKGAPFVRISRKGSLNLFDKTAQAFGAQINDTLKPVGGYHRNLKLDLIASGGSATNLGATPADGPYNVISLFVLRDPFNTPVINCDGYGLYLIDKWGAQAGGPGFSNISSRPSASTTINTTTGAFQIPFTIPFELDSAGYCSMIGLSAAAEPQYTINLAASTTVYTTAANFTTAATVELACYSNFWAVPTQDPSLAPPDIGSTAQWSQGVAASAWSQSTNQRIQVPRVGTFLHTLIFQLRDQGASNARVDQYPSTDLTLWIDGVPFEYERDIDRKDKMYDMYGLTPDTGVRVYSFKDDVDQTPSLATTHDYLLYTTPSTLLELGGTAGSGGTGPFRLTATTGELWPNAGIPYSHLAA